MKGSLIITVIILGVGLTAGWRKQVEYRKAREILTRVEAEAAAAGISIDGDAGAAERAAKIAERDDHREEVRQFSRELIAFARDMEEAQKGGEPDEGMKKRMLSVFQRLLDLSGSDFKILIEEVRESPDLTDQQRQQLVMMSVMMLSQQQPRTALELLTESGDLVELGQMEKHALSMALSSWATEDPQAALKWIEDNADKHGDLINNDTRRAVVTGAAIQDPKLAIEIARKLKMGGEIGHSLAEAAKTPEQRSRLLAVLRENGDKELQRNALASLGADLSQAGFEAARTWMEGANLNDQERDSVSQGLQYWQTGKETGRWIEWIDTACGKEGEGKVKDLMQQWTRNDYRAAGEWLAEADDGPTKPQAVAGYVQAVAPYDPAAAAKWVDTLAEGDLRQESARELYQQWRGEDEEAAKAFAEKEGISTD
ncbi:hypothetical protein [Haloferula sargassicola]|uniref:HEAT repeat domain-containing protein n=1 Tax=Haloferula sargassicola TaxID=490096 RepID=A0ABP9UL81_9BACT